MPFLVISFLASLLVALLVIHSAERHGHRSADHDLDGPQKFHFRPVPRIGGIAVFLAVLAGALFAQLSADPDRHSIWLLIVSSLPTFTFGLAEDLTKGVSPRRRLFFTAVSAALAIFLLGGVIHRTTIPGVDHLITMTPFAIALTLLVVTGVSNAINIIDGFNGLASMFVLMMFASICYVAFKVVDTIVVTPRLLTS